MNFKRSMNIIYKFCILCGVFFAMFFPYHLLLGQDTQQDVGSKAILEKEDPENSNSKEKKKSASGGLSQDEDLDIILGKRNSNSKNKKKSTLEKLKGLRLSLGIGLSTGFFSSLYGIDVITLAHNGILKAHPFGFDLIDEEKSKSVGLPIPIGVELNFNIEYNIPKVRFLTIRSGLNAIIYTRIYSRVVIKPYNILTSELLDNIFKNSVELTNSEGDRVGFREFYNDLLDVAFENLGDLGDGFLGRFVRSIREDLILEDDVAGALENIIDLAEIYLRAFGGIRLSLSLPLAELDLEVESRGIQLEIPFMLGFNLFENKKGAFYILAGISYIYGSLYILEKGIAPAPEAQQEAVGFSLSDITLFNPTRSLRTQLADIEVSNTFISHGLGIGAGIGGRFNITKNVYIFGELKFVYSTTIAAIKKTRGKISDAPDSNTTVSDFFGALQAVVDSEDDESVGILQEPLIFALQALPFSLSSVIDAFSGLLDSVFPDIKNDEFFKYEPVQLNPPSPISFRFILGVGYAF